MSDEADKKVTSGAAGTPVRRSWSTSGTVP